MSNTKRSKIDTHQDIESLMKENSELKAKLLELSSEVDSPKSANEFPFDFENFFNLAIDLLCIADTEGNFIKVNKAWENTLGYKVSELENRKFIDLVHPDDLKATIEATKRLSQQKQVLNFVNRYITKEGEWRFIEWRSLPHGNYIFAAARDITERIRNQGAMGASEERYSLVIDATELGIWDWDVETNKVYYSPQWKNQVGYKDHELKNEFKTWEDLLHPDDYERMHNEVADYLANPKEHFIAEFRLRHKNGNYVWIRNKASAKKNEHGKVTRFFGAHTDITEQKKSEEYIRQSKETYRGIIDSLNEAIYLQDEHGTFIEVNKTAEKFYGYKHDFFIGKTPEFLSAPDLNNLDEVVKIVSNAFNGKPGSFEFWGKRKDGTIFPKEVSVSPGWYFGKKIVIAVSRDITERKNAELLIKEKTEQIESQYEEYKQLSLELLETKSIIEASEKKYRNLVENLFDGIYMLRGKKFSYVNPRFEEISGYSAKEITSDDFNFNSLLTEKSERIVEERFKDRMRGHNLPIRYEIEIVTKSSEIKNVELATVQVPIEGEIQIIGIMKDITLKRKMEREIAQRTKLQSLLVNLSAKFINISYQQFDKEINSALAEMGTFSGVDRVYIFSYDFENDTMSNTYEWCSEGTSRQIDNLQNLPNSKVAEWVENHKKGKSVHIPKVDELPEGLSVRKILESQDIKSIITIPMFYESKCIGFVGFDSVRDYKEWHDSEMSLLRLFVELLVNVHIKTQFENSLRKAKVLAEHKRAEVRNIIDNSPVGIALISPRGKVIDINSAAIAMLDAPSVEQVINLDIFKVKGLETSGFIRDFKKCIDQKSMVWNESRFVSRWGKQVYAKYYLVPIIIEGVIESVLTNVEDITNIKDAEQKLIALKDKAQESDRLKSAFLANMSHEIRTPMNAICGFSNLLLDESIEEDQKKNFVEIININGQQLLSIINDIIDISKIESGQITVSKTKFSVNELLKETEIVYAQLAKMKGVDFACKLGLPDNESIIESDEMKLKQILNNIVFNAIKFTEKGKVEVGYRLSGNLIEFFVKDTGIGVPQDKLDLIFERFQQVDNGPHQSRKGTGLGLPISKAFVELLGGTIWINSKVGVGSTFFFTIPYTSAKGKVHKAGPSDDYTYIWEGKTILIAEDDDPNYLYLEQILLPTKANLVWAVNGQEAIDICLNQQVDLVLMDLKMPIKTGLEATVEIRKHGKNMPIIAQTAYAFSEDKEIALQSGCDHYISKPIDRNELLSLINGII